VKLNSEKGSNKRANTGRKFEDQLSEVERAAWKSFKIVTKKFVGNYKAEKYRGMVADLVPSYKA
jgi:predicted transcriptional regulator YheO